MIVFNKTLRRGFLVIAFAIVTCSCATSTQPTSAVPTSAVLTKNIWLAIKVQTPGGNWVLTPDPSLAAVFGPSGSYSFRDGSGGESGTWSPAQHGVTLTGAGSNDALYIGKDPARLGLISAFILLSNSKGYVIGGPGTDVDAAMLGNDLVLSRAGASVEFVPGPPQSPESTLSSTTPISPS